MEKDRSEQVTAQAERTQVPPAVVGQSGVAAVEPMADSVDDMAAWTSLLENSDRAYCALEYGDIVEGIVMQVDEDEILVDIGAKSEGVVPSREFRKAQQAGELAGLKVGDPVYVFVLKPEDEDERAVLSIDRGRLGKSWHWLEQMYQEGAVLEAVVDGYNKGGLLVNLRGVRGFVPASQVAGIVLSGQTNHQDSLAQIVGQTIPLKVIEIDRRRNRLILSQRQALQDYRDSRREKLLDSLQVGQTYRGVVSSICRFGVFVDLGGADGLVHLSELSWKRVNHPREVVQVGQEVDVYVLGIDRARKRIALSLRRTQPEPWSTVTERYQLGQLVWGEVTQLASFGAFVSIEEGIEGLVHLSELSDTAITHPQEVVHEGDKVLLRIIRIDPVNRRIGLSLRRAQQSTDEVGTSPVWAGDESQVSGAEAAG